MIRNNVHLATPSYNNTVSTNYMKTLLDINKENEFDFSYLMMCGDSLITRSRNALFSEYVANRMLRGNTHLLWMDDDIGFEHGALKSMIDRHVDMTGLAVPLRQHDRSRGITCAVEGIKKEIDEMFYEVMRLGCGIMLWSNDLVDSLVEYCQDNGLVYNNSKDKSMIYFDLFQVGSNNGYYLSEDYVVCEIIRSLGYPIYVDSSWEVTHSQPNDIFVKPPLPVDPRALEMKERDPLPVDQQSLYWTPADWILGYIG